MPYGKIIVTLAAMIFLTLIEYMALQQGFDGSLLLFTTAAIAGLAGYQSRGGSPPSQPTGQTK